MKIVLASLALAFLSVGVVHAHTPIVSLDPVPTLTFDSFPQTYNVTGVVEHSPIASVKSLTLWVNGVSEVVNADPFPLMVGTTSPYTLPWNVVGPGTYTLYVTARHGTTGQIATSTEDAVDVILEEIQVNVTCEAAPARAQKYLKDGLNIKPGSTVFKNVMRRVARESGSDGLLWAKEACEAGYQNKVEDFVDGLL
ncbi:MAG: hypothetical protein AAB458_00790 [Patescibacteria group bacterium]